MSNHYSPKYCEHGPPGSITIWTPFPARPWAAPILIADWITTILSDFAVLRALPGPPDSNLLSQPQAVLKSGRRASAYRCRNRLRVRKGGLAVPPISGRT